MTIDFIKVSEILFEGLIQGFIQGLIGVVIVLVTYQLGIIQSDRNWRREFEVHARDIKRQEKQMKIIRQIEQLREVMQFFPFVSFLIKDGPSFLQNRSRMLEDLIKTSFIATTTFYDDYEISECLNDLHELTEAYVTGGNQDEFFKEFIDIQTFLKAKLRGLESDLRLMTNREL